MPRRLEPRPPAWWCRPARPRPWWPRWPWGRRSSVLFPAPPSDWRGPRAAGSAPARSAGPRRALDQALRAARGPANGAQAEVYLLMCATHAAGGDAAAARLALAHVSREQRQDPGSALVMAICQAALGNEGAAMAFLE